MNWLTYVNWLAGPLLQITLLVFMVRRKSHKLFPRFFSYILFQTLKSACLFVVYRYFPESYYFDAYWTGNAVSVIFAVTVMDEILHSLFKEYGGIQILGTTIFRWSCGLLFLLAILGALSSSEAASDRIVAAVFSFDRSMRLMQVGLFLVLMLLCRFLKNYSRQQVFGIALGFGVFASIELILVSIVMLYGNAQPAIVSLLKSTAYNAVTLVWIGYLKQQPQLVPKRLERGDALVVVDSVPTPVRDQLSAVHLDRPRVVRRVTVHDIDTLVDQPVREPDLRGVDVVAPIRAPVHGHDRNVVTAFQRQHPVGDRAGAAVGHVGHISDARATSRGRPTVRNAA